MVTSGFCYKVKYALLDFNKRYISGSANRYFKPIDFIAGIPCEIDISTAVGTFEAIVVSGVNRLIVYRVDMQRKFAVFDDHQIFAFCFG